MGDQTSMNGGGITFAGRYKVFDRLGEGSFAMVYKAKDIQTGEIVAVKVLDQKLSRDKELRQRFLNEAKSQQRMDHPNVVKAFASGVEEVPGRTFHFLVMEYVERIRQGIIENKFSINAKLEIIRQIALGLAHAHSLGLVNRDVKPDNILTAYVNPGAVQEIDSQIITELSNIISKMSDFGIAMDENMRLTLTGTTMGTPYYMSPEQAEGAKDLDHRADIYGLGAAAYDLFTGIPPFSEYVAESRNAALVMNAKIERKPFIPPNQIEGVNMPPVLEGIIMKAMADEASQRYDSMLRFVDDIDIFLSDQPISSLSSTFFGNGPGIAAGKPRTTRHEKEGNKKYVWMGAGGVAAAVLGAVLMLSGGKKEPAMIPKPQPKPKSTATPVEVPSVKEPTPLEQYMKLEPAASSLEDDIADFLSGGSTDLDRLDSLKSRVRKIQPQVSGFQVEAAQDMSKRLFSDVEKLAERGPLIKDYQNLERRAEAILDDAGMALNKAELSQAALERSAGKLGEARDEIGGYKGKLDVSRLEGRLATCTDRVARSIVELKKQKAKQAIEAPKLDPVDPLGEAYSNFAKKLSGGLFPAVAKYGESASYNTQTLSELMASVNEARAEAGKYKGRKGAQELSDRLEACEEELKAFEGFIKGRGRSLLSEIARYEQFLTRKGGLLEKPKKREVASSIRRAQYFIERLGKYGKPAEPKVNKLKGLIARLQGQKEEPKEKVAAASKDSVLHMTFDEGTVVYRNGQWIVKDLSGKNNHGIIHGKFAWDIRTGKPIIFPTYAAGVQAGYEIFLVDMSKETKVRGDLAGGLNGGHISLPNSEGQGTLEAHFVNRSFEISMMFFPVAKQQDYAVLITNNEPKGKFRGLCVHYYLGNFKYHNNVTDDYIATQLPNIDGLTKLICRFNLKTGMGEIFLGNTLIKTGRLQAYDGGSNQVFTIGHDPDMGNRCLYRGLIDNIGVR